MPEKPDAALLYESSIFASPAYAEARQARLRNLFAHVDRASLAGKRVLELGCGAGDLGQAFVDLGCNVVSVDARPEHIAALRARYPSREVHLADLEQWDFSSLGRFDIILCFGVLYHLAAPREFLARCASTSQTIFLETIVTDSAQAVAPIEDEDGAAPNSDQSFSGRGCRPSPAWIERTLQGLGFTVQDISTSLANWGGSYPSQFDWIPEGRGEWFRGRTRLRKMFICSRA